MSRAVSGVRRASAGWPIIFRVCWMRSSERRFEKWRLVELHGETLAERAVEDGIAGGVGEIGKDDGVFGSERRSAVEESVNAVGRGGDESEGDNDCGGGSELVLAGDGNDGGRAGRMLSVGRKRRDGR